MLYVHFALLFIFASRAVWRGSRSSRGREMYSDGARKTADKGVVPGNGRDDERPAKN